VDIQRLELGIPPKIAQHKIKSNTTIPHVHQVRYQLNPKHATIIKQDIDKLSITSFIKSIEEVTWLSPIVVVPENMCGFQEA
jgi:hypothetical protein